MSSGECVLNKHWDILGHLRWTQNGHANHEKQMIALCFQAEAEISLRGALLDLVH